MPLVERKKRLARLVRAAKCSRQLMLSTSSSTASAFSRRFAPATVRELWPSENWAFTRTTHPAG